VRPEWWSRRAVLLHLTALVVVPGCLALGWWQLSRALAGNALSWAYTFEWPFFAAYGLFMWWRILHERPDDPAGAAPGRAANVLRDEDPRPEDDELDEELAAYNRYLAELHAEDQRKLP
jgi:hypothetical protein